MQNCDLCGGKKWFSRIDAKTGLQVVQSDGRRVWRCWRCGHIQEEAYIPVLPVLYRTTANVLYIDLEISKSMMFNYGLRVPTKYVNPDDLLHSYYMVCWSASYVGSKTVYGDCVTPKDARAWNDKRILKQLHDLMEAADIIAGHNVDGYDVKRANTRFLLNGLDPIVGKKTIDTLKVARSKFCFESNRLDFISQALGFRGKDHIDNSDWLKIVKTGDEKTLKRVRKYNKGDVTSGKAVLERLMKYSGKPRQFGAVVLA